MNLAIQGDHERYYRPTEFAMETSYRFRFLIYVAAFMLVMSLCFVYAEPLPSRNHLLFQVSPQHAGFLAPSTQEPAFNPAALRAAAAVVSPMSLQRLKDASHGRHGFLRHAKHAGVRLVPSHVINESSVLGSILESPQAASSAR
jgi:hypothetical protein